MRGTQKKSALSHHSTFEFPCRLLGISILGHFYPDRLVSNFAVWSTDDDDECVCTCTRRCICKNLFEIAFFSVVVLVFAFVFVYLNEFVFISIFSR